MKGIAFFMWLGFCLASCQSKPSGNAPMPQSATSQSAQPTPAGLPTDPVKPKPAGKIPFQREWIKPNMKFTVQELQGGKTKVMFQQTSQGGFTKDFEFDGIAQGAFLLDLDYDGFFEVYVAVKLPGVNGPEVVAYSSYKDKSAGPITVKEYDRQVRGFEENAILLNKGQLKRVISGKDVATRTYGYKLAKGEAGYILTAQKQ